MKAALAPREGNAGPIDREPQPRAQASANMEADGR